MGTKFHKDPIRTAEGLLQFETKQKVHTMHKLPDYLILPNKSILDHSGCMYEFFYGLGWAFMQCFNLAA